MYTLANTQKDVSGVLYRGLCVVPCGGVGLALALKDVLWSGSKNVVNELQVVSPHLFEVGGENHFRFVFGKNTIT